MMPSSDRVDVILVDEADRDLGRLDKLEAHRRGVLHRAVSVFAYDARGRLLLQQRATGKYHSGGLWSNSACTHPREGESLAQAVCRGMREELGIEPAELQYAFPFTYRAEVGAGLVEHEYDHVFVGRVDEVPRAEPSEVSATEFVDPDIVLADVAANPLRYSPWFRLLLPPVTRWRLSSMKTTVHERTA